MIVATKKKPLLNSEWVLAAQEFSTAARAWRKPRTRARDAVGNSALTSD
jgi:hypothetical protein